MSEVPAVSDAAHEYVFACLTAFLRDALPVLARTYQWKIPEPVPFDAYEPRGTTRLDQNLGLRSFLADRWAKANAEERFEIARWYVRDWGHVRRNGDARLRDYAEREPVDLLKRRLAGIASWSKVLAIRDPRRFAIYDARVATSLNAVQLAYGDRELKVRFDRLPGRNKTLNVFWSKREEWAGWKTAQRIESADAYSLYLNILEGQNRLRRRAEDWHLYEMALFAAAEELAQRALAKEK